MKKATVILVVLLLLILVTSTLSYAWSDDFGPWGKRGHHRGERHGVAEPIAIGLVAVGLAGLGIYALKKHKKN